MSLRAVEGLAWALGVCRFRLVTYKMLASASTMRLGS